MRKLLKLSAEKLALIVMAVGMVASIGYVALLNYLTL
jgi:hypothetical protein